MHLSSIYRGPATMWAMVYHTQPGSDEVELVKDKFFLSKKKALKWFRRKHKPEHFIQPEAVKVTIKLLSVSPTDASLQVDG